MLGVRRGDTMVEVIVAFAVFALVATGAIAVMNRGLTVTERSLEITLVREQIDAQAQLLRYARDTDSTAWNDILGNLADSGGDGCPINGGMITPPSQAFIASVSSSTPREVTYTKLGPGIFEQPGTYSQFTLDDSPKSYGLWVVPVRVGLSNSYDMHIYACWHGPGDTAPTKLGTIVRLYET